MCDDRTGEGATSDAGPCCSKHRRKVVVDSGAEDSIGNISDASREEAKVVGHGDGSTRQMVAQLFDRTERFADSLAAERMEHGGDITDEDATIEPSPPLTARTSRVRLAVHDPASDLIAEELGHIQSIVGLRVESARGAETDLLVREAHPDRRASRTKVIPSDPIDAAPEHHRGAVVMFDD